MGHGHGGQNKLKFEDYHRLTLWMGQHRDRILSEKPRLPDLAIEASKDLEITVKGDHIQRVKKMLGIEWTSARPASATASKDKRRGMNRVIVSSILDLYHQLGAKQPSALLALFDTLSKPKERPLDILSKETPTPPSGGQAPLNL